VLLQGVQPISQTVGPVAVLFAAGVEGVGPVLEAISKDTEALNTLYAASQTLLSEEPMRCAVTIAKVRRVCMCDHRGSFTPAQALPPWHPAIYKLRHPSTHLALKCPMQIRSLGLTRSEKESMREGWKEIVSLHLDGAATYPLNIDEAEKARMAYLLRKSIRRRVLFNDDCMEIRASLDEVS
jgi:hypothetical protein